MDSGSFLLLIGEVLGVVLGFLALLVAMLWLVHVLDTRVGPATVFRRELARRSFDRELIEIVIDDAVRGWSLALPSLLFVAAVGAEAFGCYELRTIVRPEDEELLLYPMPGLVLAGLSVLWFVLSLRRGRRGGPLYRVLVTDAARTRFIVETSVRMWVNDTTALEALAGKRAAVQADVPHVVLVTEFGEELMIRSDERPNLGQAIARVLPAAQRVPWGSWHDGLGRTLLARRPAVA